MCEPHRGDNNEPARNEHGKIQTETKRSTHIHLTSLELLVHRERIKKPRLQITSNVRLNITSNAKTSHPSPLHKRSQKPLTPSSPQGPPRNTGHGITKVPTTRHSGEATRLKCSLGAASGTPSHDGARKCCVYAVGLLILKTGEI